MKSQEILKIIDSDKYSHVYKLNLIQRISNEEALFDIAKTHNDFSYMQVIVDKLKNENYLSHIALDKVKDLWIRTEAIKNIRDNRIIEDIISKTSGFVKEFALIELKKREMKNEESNDTISATSSM